MVFIFAFRYPGQSVQSEFGDQTINGNSYQTSNGPSHGTQKSPSYTQASPGTYHNYHQNYNQVNVDDHQNSVKSGISPGSCHPSQKPSGMYSQNSPKSYNMNPSPQNYQEVSPGQNRNVAIYENRTINNGSMYQSERFDQQNYPAPSPSSQNFGQNSPGNVNQDKSNVNARIKSMIMNKHQINQNQQQNLTNKNFSGSNENHMMSPNRDLMSPSQQHSGQLMSPMLQNSQLMSPLQNTNQLLSPNHPNNQMISSNQMNSPNSKDSKTYVDKIQQNDYGEKKEMQMNENSNHFLAFSHHLREGSLLQPEGGGVRNWTGRHIPGSNYQFRIKSNFYDPIAVDNQSRKCKKKRENQPSVMENFVRFASANFQKRKLFSGFEGNNHSNIKYNVNDCYSNYNGHVHDEFSACVNFCENSKSGNYFRPPDPIRNLEVNFPTKRNAAGNAMTKPSVTGNFIDSIDQKFYSGFQNFNSPCAINADNYHCKRVVKQKDSLKKEACLIQSDSGYQQYQSCRLNSFDKTNYNPTADKQREKLEFSQCRMNYGCAEYEKQYIKSEFPFLNNDYLEPSCRNVKIEEDVKPNCLAFNAQFVTSPTTKVEYPKMNFECDTNKEKEEQKDGNKTEEISSSPLYPKISYAPNFKNMEVIDRRFLSGETDGKTKWKNYQKDRVNEKTDNEEIKKENYLFEGEGGPISLKASSGAWCCRLGGTEPPSAEHIKIGGCQVRRRLDKFTARGF